ncbi:12151_t:CDS:2, partial [Rhizophagus irregularis]
MEIQMAIKVAEERHLRLIQEEQIAREEHKARAQKLARDEAGYYGTTPHYLDKRRKLTDDSTTLNKIYHDSMSRYRKRLLYNQDNTGILPARRYAHKDRTTDENSASTSEDTKDLE